MSKKKLSLYMIMEILGESIGENLADYTNEDDEYEGGISAYADAVAAIVASEFSSEHSSLVNLSNIQDVVTNLSESLRVFASDLMDLEEEFDEEDD